MMSKVTSCDGFKKRGGGGPKRRRPNDKICHWEKGFRNRPSATMSAFKSFLSIIIGIIITLVSTFRTFIHGKRAQVQDQKGPRVHKTQKRASMMKAYALFLVFICGSVGSVQVRCAVAQSAAPRGGFVAALFMSCGLSSFHASHIVSPILPHPTPTGVLHKWRRRSAVHAGVGDDAEAGRVWRRGPAAVPHPRLHREGDARRLFVARVYKSRGL